MKTAPEQAQLPLGIPFRDSSAALHAKVGVPLRYAEFCTGVGGFRLGIESSGLDARLVYSNEINEACAKTYRRNFGRTFDSTDLLSLNPADIPEFDMMCAGFPCQPFSIAGKTLGFNDRRGNIFFKLLEITCFDEKELFNHET